MVGMDAKAIRMTKVIGEESSMVRFKAMTPRKMINQGKLKVAMAFILKRSLGL